MHTLSKLIACSASVALLASTGAAFAQAARPAPRAAAPAAAAPNPSAGAALPQGPAIPGVCVFSTEGAIGASAVGKYVAERMKQISGQAQAEIQGEATALQTDAKAFDAQRTTLSSDVQQQRALTLQQRDQQLQRKAELRNRELQATEQKALARIQVELNPLLREVYGQHNCSLLLDGNAVFGANQQMNITPEVVRLLDGKITQFPFEREHLDTQAAATPVGGAAHR